jgi:hypothetical protein
MHPTGTYTDIAISRRSIHDLIKVIVTPTVDSTSSIQGTIVITTTAQHRVAAATWSVGNLSIIITSPTGNTTGRVQSTAMINTAAQLYVSSS